VIKKRVCTFAARKWK